MQLRFTRRSLRWAYLNSVAIAVWVGASLVLWPGLCKPWLGLITCRKAVCACDVVIHKDAHRPHGLQGVYPAGLEKVKSQELREFITQCIAHDPDSRPGTHQLLKHPFFESIRTGKVQVERCTQLVDRPSEELQVILRRVCSSNTSQHNTAADLLGAHLDDLEQTTVANTAVRACQHTSQPVFCLWGGFYQWAGAGNLTCSRVHGGLC